MWKTGSIDHFLRRKRGEPGTGAPSAPQPVRPTIEPFTPTRPQRGSGLVGRRTELRRILEAFWDEHAHVVLYADRGQGKTSLSNRIIELLGNEGFAIGRYVCSTGSTFDEIIRGQARDLAFSFLAVPLRDGEGLQGCEAALPARTLSPADVVALPGRLNAQRVVLIIDEFDRLENEQTKNMIADTLKHVSDRALNLSFFLIGVSSSLEQLLGHHPSIQRNVVGITLPAMTSEEIGSIIERGAAISEVSFSPRLVREVVRLANGSPYLAHLLGLRLLQSARRRESKEVTIEDLETALWRVGHETGMRHWPGSHGSVTRLLETVSREWMHASD